ncbi:MAG: DUF1501 domain-containing protein [Jatrophihabitantaceae bacterium]
MAPTILRSAELWQAHGGNVRLRKRVTVAVMTGFGRRVAMNASDGTDHGHGSVLWLLGEFAQNRLGACSPSAVFPGHRTAPIGVGTTG